METNKKKLWIGLGVLLVIVIIAIVATTKPKAAVTPVTDTNTAPAAEQTAPAAEQATNTAPVVTNPVLKDATIVVPGANPVTKDNKVVTQEGKQTQNNVVPMTPSAPQQTAPIASTATLSNSVIKLGVSASGWDPKEFTVKVGAPTTVAVSSTDGYTHVFMFDDTSLSAVAVGVGPKETRAITFNAPAKAGNYSFHCDVPGHTGRGEVGVMIVK